MSSHSPEGSVGSVESLSSFTPVNGRDSSGRQVNGHSHPAKGHQMSNGVHGGSPSDMSSGELSPSHSPKAMHKDHHGAQDGLPNGESRNGNRSDSETHYKRKRSSTGDYHEPGTTSKYDYSPPKRAEHQEVADRALHMLDNTDRTKQFVAASTNGHHYSHSQTNGWHEQAPNGAGPYTNGADQMDSSDTRLAEALQKATHQNETPQHQRHMTGQSKASSVETDDRSAYQQDQSHNGTGSGQEGQPKRKRVFSNRTKTGCLTCRKRKKKCDEGQPKCQNCLRGSFTCEGYNTRNIWQKTPGTKEPVPLQSKEGFSTTVETPDKPYTHSPAAKRSSLHYDGAQSRPITIDDIEPGHAPYTASPHAVDARRPTAYPGQGWPPSGQPLNGPDRLPSFSQFERVGTTNNEYPPPPHQQQPPPPPTRPPPPSTHHMSQPPQHPAHSQAPVGPGQSAGAPPAPNPQTGHWQPPSQQIQFRPQYQPPHNDPNPLPPAEWSKPRQSFDLSKTGPKTFTSEEVEKSRMLRNSRYNHFDATLKSERNRCEKALKRYNAACEENSGVSEAEAQRLLEKVVDPGQDRSHNFVVPCKERGILGPGVKVEAPFTCTYGYNLKLLDSVCIGKNCNFDDAAIIEIGPRSWIGPNVTILTTDVSKDMVDRKGTESVWVARPVSIASEVVVGANAVIYPGVKLGRGSTVEAFAVVKESLGENVTQRVGVGGRVGM